MEHHRHLYLNVEVRDRLLGMNATTIDRLLRPVRASAKHGRRKASLNTPLRKSIAIRTYEDRKNPPRGYFEMDMVAHCGHSVAGSHIHSLVLTDIASGWAKAAALIVREWRIGADIHDRQNQPSAAKVYCKSGRPSFFMYSRKPSNFFSPTYSS